MSHNWTREQIIVALNVYCKIPFKILAMSIKKVMVSTLLSTFRLGLDNV